MINIRIHIIESANPCQICVDFERFACEEREVSHTQGKLYSTHRAFLRMHRGHRFVSEAFVKTLQEATKKNFS